MSLNFKIIYKSDSFIEKLSFNAFNEGTRLGNCIKMHKRLFGVDAKKKIEILYIFFVLLGSICHIIAVWDVLMEYAR